MKERSPEATCKTCPYWYWRKPRNPSAPTPTGQCRRRADCWVGDREESDWCGEHPGFFHHGSDPEGI